MSSKKKTPLKKGGATTTKPTFSSSAQQSTGQSPPASIGNLEDTAKPFKNRNYKPARRYRNLKQVLTSEKSTEYPLDFPTWWSTEAPPSVLPRPKYCDITGYEAPYTDPKTNLRYCNAQVYQYIQQLPPGTEQQYLELRNAHVVLK